MSQKTLFISSSRSFLFTSKVSESSWKSSQSLMTLAIDHEFRGVSFVLLALMCISSLPFCLLFLQKQYCFCDFFCFYSTEDEARPKVGQFLRTDIYLLLRIAISYLLRADPFEIHAQINMSTCLP